MTCRWGGRDQLNGDPVLALFFCGCNQSNLSTSDDKGNKFLACNKKKQRFYAAF
jgi:hypothetical protein